MSARKSLDEKETKELIAVWFALHDRPTCTIAVWKQIALESKRQAATYAENLGAEGEVRTCEIDWLVSHLLLLLTERLERWPS